MTCEILKNETCVLTPRECDALFDKLNSVYRAICEALLYSHMRIEEMFWFIENENPDHPRFYRVGRKCISLPKEGIKKERTWYKERDVRLSLQGCAAIERLLALHLKKRDLMGRAALNVAIDVAAQKAGLGPVGMCPKMFRKTMISWLVAAYPNLNVWINASAGHSSDVQLRHYVGIAFSDADLEIIRERCRGWEPV